MDTFEARVHELSDYINLHLDKVAKTQAHLTHLKQSLAVLEQEKEAYLTKFQKSKRDYCEAISKTEQFLKTLKDD